MTRPTRVHNFGTYFTTAQTWERRSILNVDELASMFVDVLFRYRAQGKYSLHDFVVMPDHVHLIITRDQIDVAKAMQYIKGGFSHAVGQTGRKLEIWQKGFTDHRIRDWDDFSNHRSYLRNNPVKRRLCVSADEFPYSSVNRKYVLDPVPEVLRPA